MASATPSLQKVKEAFSLSIKREKARLLAERALLLSVRNSASTPGLPDLTFVRLHASAILRGLPQ